MWWALFVRAQTSWARIVCCPHQVSRGRCIEVGVRYGTCSQGCSGVKSSLLPAAGAALWCLLVLSLCGNSLCGNARGAKVTFEDPGYDKPWVDRETEGAACIPELQMNWCILLEELTCVLQNGCMEHQASHATRQHCTHYVAHCS